MKIFFSFLIGFTVISFADLTRVNGIVTDTVSKLEWQDDYSDNDGDIKYTTWQESINYCENLVLDEKSNWRLPNINELNSIVDDTKRRPSINNIFKSTNSNIYWSSTTNMIAELGFNRAWCIEFEFGGTGSPLKTKKHFVRCVKDIEKNSRFIKIDSSGEKLDDSAMVWAYTYDTKTSILWENKIDKDNIAQFNSTSPNYSDLEKIHDYDNSYSVDNVNQIIQKMNNEDYFDVDSWALPSSQEFIDLIKDSEFDKKYFPNFEGAFYSSTVVKNGRNSTTLEKVFLETGQKSTGMVNYTYKALFVVHDYSLE